MVSVFLALTSGSSWLLHLLHYFLFCFSFVPFGEGCARVLNNTRHRLKSALQLGGMGAEIRADKGVGVGQWAADGVCLCHIGIHSVSHLRGMRASIVAQVVIMGWCMRGSE
jgi:hypothetical protein